MRERVSVIFNLTNAFMKSDITTKLIEERELYIAKLKIDVETHDNENNVIFHPAGGFTRDITEMQFPDSVGLKGITSGEIKGRAKLIIDDNIKEVFKNLTSFPLSEKAFLLYKTGDVVSNDLDIIHHFSLNDLQRVPDLIGTAFFLIALDLDHKGYLHQLSCTGHENINLGYALLKDQTQTLLPHMLWVEKPKRQNSSLPEYHIHSAVIPRPYKPHRYTLIEKK